MPPESIANVLFMSSGGEIDRHETEIVILRVAHFRRCQRVLLTAVDELVRDKDIQDETWRALRSEYSIPQLVELCLLVGHYEMLATTITALRIPRDFATER